MTAAWILSARSVPPPGRSIMTPPEITDLHDGDFSLHYTRNTHLSALEFGGPVNDLNLTKRSGENLCQ
jgi:hypothetical protein